MTSLVFFEEPDVCFGSHLLRRRPVARVVAACRKPLSLSVTFGRWRAARGMMRPLRMVAAANIASPCGGAGGAVLGVRWTTTWDALRHIRRLAVATCYCRRLLCHRRRRWDRTFRHRRMEQRRQRKRRRRRRSRRLSPQPPSAPSIVVGVSIARRPPRRDMAMRAFRPSPPPSTMPVKMAS